MEQEQEQEQINKDFEETCKLVKGLTDATNEELLELYALYKQGTIGDNNTQCPSMFNYKDRQKWNAWTTKKGMKEEDAKKEYSKFGMSLLAKQEAE